MTIVLNLMSAVSVDTSSGGGGSPVLATNLGEITVTGAQVASGTTADVIQTNSTADNTFAIQIQRSAAVGSSTVGDNGVCHFNSGIFSVDSNGFVAFSSSFYATGTFTPTIVGVSTAGTATYVTQTGLYTQIGNRVFFDVLLSWNTATGTGQLQIQGLPVTANSSGSAAIDIGAISAPLGSGGTSAYIVVNGSATTANVSYVEGVTGTLTAFDVPAAAVLQVQGSYQI